MIMYKVEVAWLGTASIEKLEVQKVTEKTVLTEKGHRYLKKCQSYELFDSFSIAKNCAVKYTKQHIESLERRLVDAKERLEKLESMEI